MFDFDDANMGLAFHLYTRLGEMQNIVKSIDIIPI